MGGGRGGAYDRGDYDYGSSEGGKSVEGVRLWLVRAGDKQVPVVDMDKDSTFVANVSWLFQQALDCSGKAESQFEYCNDRDIVAEVRALGFSKDEIACARLVREDLRHLRAVGVAGKRSVMMSCVIALYRDPGSYTMNHKAFWESLQDYDLARPFEDLIETVDGKQEWSYSSHSSSNNRSNSSGGGGYGGREEETVEKGTYRGHGIELNVVCQKIPVVNLETSSIFHGNASWLLQAVTGELGKADGLYEYVEDRAIIKECSSALNLSYEEMSIARLKAHPEIIAVGTNGKRSVMLALCLALALEDEACGEDLSRDIKVSDDSLLEPLGDVLRNAYARYEIKPGKGGGKGQKRGASRDDGDSYGYDRSSSRKRQSDEDYDYRGRGSGLRSRSRGRRRGGLKAAKKPKYDSSAKASQLDRALEDYWRNERRSPSRSR